MNLLNGSIYSINAAALLIGAASFLSRLLGVVRDRLLAGEFGASRALDIYYAAFQIPDILFVLFLLGAGSAAIIPIFIEARERSEEESRQLIYELIVFFSIGATVLVVLAVVLAPLLITLIAPGFNTDERATATMLTRIMILQSGFLGISSIISSVIQSNRKFVIFAMSAVFYNVGIIAGILFLYPIFGMTGLALGVVVGAVLHFVVQLPTFFGLGFRMREFWSLLRHFGRANLNNVFRVVALSLPRVIAISARHVTTIALVAIASTLAVGSITIFQLANNLHFLPIGIFGASFAVAAFPSLSERFIKKDAGGFFELFYSTFRSILFWMLPLSMMFYVLRAQIVRVALGAGQFDWADTRLTAASLALLALAIFTESFGTLMIRSFYALENTRKPLFINIIASLITIGSALVFLKTFMNREHAITTTVAGFLKVGDISDISILAVALAVSVGGLVNFIFLMRGVRKEATRVFRVELIKHPWHDTLKMFFAALIGSFITFGTLRIVNLMVTLDTFFGVFVQGAVAFMVGIMVYGALLFIWGNDEIHHLLAAVRRRLLHAEVLPSEIDDNDIK